MKERIERLDSVEARTALLWLWLAGFALFAFVLSFNWPTMNFAQWPIAFFFAVAIIEGLRYFAMALRGISESEEYAEEEEEDAENAQFGTQRESETTLRYYQPSADELQERRRFYAFVHGVCVNQALGEGTWEKRNVSAATYQKWIKLLQQAGIVSSVEPGGRRRVLMGWQEALVTIARLSNEPDYFKDAMHYYNATNRPSTILIAQ